MLPPVKKNQNSKKKKKKLFYKPGAICQNIYTETVNKKMKITCKFDRVATENERISKKKILKEYGESSPNCNVAARWSPVASGGSLIVAILANFLLRVANGIAPY